MQVKERAAPVFTRAAPLLTSYTYRELILTAQLLVKELRLTWTY